MTKLRGIQQRRGFRVAVIFALACAAVAVVGKTVVAGDAPLFAGLQNEQQIRADSQKQFREIHSDATGRYRPDLLNNGHRAGSAATDLVHVARRRLGQGERAGEPVRSFRRQARSRVRSGCSTAPSHCASMPSRTSRAPAPTRA